MDVESPMAIGHGVDSILCSACQLLARHGDVGSPTTPIQNDRTLHVCCLSAPTSFSILSTGGLGCPSTVSWLDTKPTYFLASRLNTMAISISTSIIACLKAFNAFVEDLQALNGKNPASFLLINAWQDELGRLRIWAANVGAHQTNQSSLDYRLRDSSHIREQIVKLLDELMKRLHEAGNAIN